MHHPHEPASNGARDLTTRLEPRALRTFTPTQAVLARAAGVFLWTPEGRQLYDFTSGVLVANLGHNPASWLRRFWSHLGWTDLAGEIGEPSGNGRPSGFVSAVPLTAY